MFKIVNINNENVIAEYTSYADTFMTRLKGLMFKRSFNKGEGLVIVPCNSIHTFWMKFPIDVVFLSQDDTVVYVIEDLKPNRISPLIRNAHSVLELPVGTISDVNIKIGDSFIYKDI